MPARIHALVVVLLALAVPAVAAEPDRMAFDSIDGGTLRLDGPALVTNTASLCAYTPQFDDLQALHEGYADDGLTVLAVPSEDFRQELASEAEVKEFCEVNFDLTLPMTVITPVKGPQAHPFYQWLARDHDIVPRWNFHKVLIGPEGDVLGQWGSPVSPTSPAITGAVEAALGG